MRKSTMPWFLTGLATTLAALFLSHAGDLRFVQRMVSPEYIHALRGLRQLETQMTLEPGQTGFAELAGLFLDRYQERSPDRELAGVSATRLERQPAVISVDETNAPEVIPVICLLSNGQTIEWDLAGLTDAVEGFRSRSVFIGALILFGIGALIQLVAYMLERRAALRPMVVDAKLDRNP
jgi:hypothetical protein